MTVYLLHFDQPLPRGVSSKGTPLQAAHYIGWTDDLAGRILDHSETTWEPLDEPIVTEDGKKIAGVTHGNGATLMGVVNSKGISWRLARTWDGADHIFEIWLKHQKKAPQFCPICNPYGCRRIKEIR
jgi:hypothetical protein